MKERPEAKLRLFTRGMMKIPEAEIDTMAQSHYLKCLPESLKDTNPHIQEVKRISSRINSSNHHLCILKGICHRKYTKHDPKSSLWKKTNYLQWKDINS